MALGGWLMTKDEAVRLRILEEYRRGELNRSEAAELLNCSVRSITRRVNKLRIKGPEGIKHGNHQRPAKNTIDGTLHDQAMVLVETRYFDFNLTHCLELLKAHHNINVSYTTFYRWCKRRGLGKRKRRRASKARVHRDRMSCEGLLLQMDGSHHKWNGEDEWCLIGMIDDATSEIPFGKFFEGETTLACMSVLRSVIEAKGVPQIIYTDEAGWAGGSSKRQHFSQFVRACAELGIRVITTSSPEAKGRIERAWNTIQDRLIPELRLAGIKTMLDSNRYLVQVFLPKYWQKRNVVKASKEESKYRRLEPYENLDEIFCMKYQRQIGNDHVVNFEAKRYRILPTEYGSLKRKEVTIHVYANGSLAILYNGKKLNHQEIQIHRRWSRQGA